MGKVSVFGGTGFVGSKYCELSNGECVKIERESREPVSDDIVYFISTTSNYNIFDDVHKDVDVNLTLLLDVLKNLEPGKSTFNFISSWFVYGDCDLPATEESYCNPKGFYSITKRAAEQMIISYCETFKIDYRILRLSNVYGAGDKGVSKKKNALQFLIEELRQDNPINLYHNGEFFRDYMHVDDIARAIDLCVEKGEKNQIYNIGSGEKVEFKDVIDIVINEFDSKSELTDIEPPEFHKTCQVKDFYMDTTKLKELGFKNKITIEEGIKNLCHGN